MAHDSEVWFITGGTSGFGFSIAKAAVATGALVVAAGLNAAAGAAENRDERISFVELDITKNDDIDAAVAGCIEKHGRIDVLINNAGYSICGAVEEVTEAEGRRMFDVNFFGAMAVTRAVLPQMRKQGSGMVVSISSVGGFDGAPGFSYYSASKFAIEGFSESLVREVDTMGIKTMVVEPSSMRTNFRGSSMAMAKLEMDAYKDTVGAVRERIKEGHGVQPGDPDRAAAVLVSVVQSPNPPFRLPLGADAFRRVRKKLAFVETELAAWERQAIDIDFPEDT